MNNEKKKVNFTMDSNSDIHHSYDLPLIKFDENNFEIHFADIKETNKTVNVEIKEIISIPTNEMKKFCLNLVAALAKYEETYKNGLGFDIPPSGDKEK